MERDIALKLRPATLDDFSNLLRWRNDPETRAQSWNSESVAAEEHEAWLKKSIANPRRRLLIAELEGIPIGTVRADLGDGPPELSWTVAPEFRGRGLGKTILKAALELLGGAATARIKSDNLSSQRIALAAGMKLVDERAGVQFWTKPR